MRGPANAGPRIAAYKRRLGGQTVQGSGDRRGSGLLDESDRPVLFGHFEKESGLWDRKADILKAHQGKHARQKGWLTMEYQLIWVHGHIEVYDQWGRFCFSADTRREAMEELEAA